MQERNHYQKVKKMGKSQHFGGDKDAVTVRRHARNNFTARLGAEREGWELLNWREWSHPDSADRIAGIARYYDALETIWQDRKGHGTQVAASEDSKLLSWLEDKYRTHPDLRGKRLTFRLLSYTKVSGAETPGIYVLEVPTILALAKIDPQSPDFLHLEGLLQQEQIMEENQTLLAYLGQMKQERKELGTFRQVASGDQIIFSVRYRR